jgi:hypothetical protein
VRLKSGLLLWRGNAGEDFRSCYPQAGRNLCLGTGLPRWNVVKWLHHCRYRRRLKITLDHVKPAVLRRLEVPLDIRIDRPHLTIQAAMAWTNSHLYELRGASAGARLIPTPIGASDFLDARKARLGDILEDVSTKTLKYLYDFGDGWEHTIKIERLMTPEPGALYPRLIEVSGRCPPELRWSMGLFRAHRSHQGP